MHVLEIEGDLKEWLFEGKKSLPTQFLQIPSCCKTEGVHQTCRFTKIAGWHDAAAMYGYYGQGYNHIRLGMSKGRVCLLRQTS